VFRKKRQYFEHVEGGGPVDVAVSQPWDKFPAEISSLYSDYPSLWHSVNDELWTKEIREGSEEFQKMQDFLQNLRGEKISILKAHKICNTALWTSFAAFYNQLSKRKAESGATFFKQNWRKDAVELRNWVWDQFNQKVNIWSFNSTNLDALPILPVIHGTQTSTAMKIASTGFAALSSLDAGYFGKGIYFSSSCLYALPYTQFGNNPSLIVALAIPGNVYPVIEHHKGTTALMGAAIKPGYNSHFVITKQDGYCVSDSSDTGCDELVVEQEAQIVPIYVVELDASTTKILTETWKRDIPSN